MIIAYRLSKSACDQEFIRTGIQPNSIQIVTLNALDKTEAERELMVQVRDCLPTSHLSFADIELLRLGGTDKPTNQVFPSYLIEGYTLLEKARNDHLIIGWDKPKIVPTPIYLDTRPSDDVIFDHLRRMVKEFRAATDQLAIALEDFNKEVAILQKQKELDKQAKIIADAAREEAQRALEAEEERKASLIPCKPDGTAIINLFRALDQFAKLPGGANWIQCVERVDATETGKAIFTGPLLEDVAIEFKLSRSVYLLVSEPQRSVFEYDVAVVVLQDDGTLQHTDAVLENCTDRGWPLLIRDQIVALLAENAPQAA